MWIAICPKCESFYVIDKYYPTYWCAHFNELITGFFNSKEIELVNVDVADKIQCKIINQDELMRKP